MDAANLRVRATLSIREALAKLDATAAGILLLVDAAGVLQRTITDGDLRRLLLAGCTLDDTLEKIPEQQPITARVGVSEADALELMRQHEIQHLPLLDAEGGAVSVLLRKSIHEQIYLSPPHLSPYEKEYVEEAFRSNWIAPLGPNVDAFEKELADYVGVGHAAAVSSGTAAIHLGLRLLGVKRGDLVFCSSLTFVASANPILYEGAEPVFIDSEPDTWCMSPAALREAFAWAAREGRKPAAVIVVSLYGQSADIDPILALCREYDVPLLEDAAESLGATYNGRQSGGFGRIGIFSFNGNKIITTSGGGMLVSDDAELVARARFLATQAKDPAPWYEHSQMGFNYRMSNVLAGIGRGQLRVLEDRIAARRIVFERYCEALHDIPGLEWMPEASFGRSTRWLTTLRLDPRHSPSELVEKFSRQKIEIRRIWKPLHQQPLFEGAQYFPHADGVSVSEELFENGLCLPSGSSLTQPQQERIILSLRDYLLRG